ncbi:U32 family peptidase [Bartonella sp. HY038]|uniref:ubiquinone anaerobic biosynthesis protein UbiV n=1 Tax=Bartonella sp. HY038 TaxID=2759660 RepID=UPI00352E3306
MMKNRQISLSMGPVYYLWDADKWCDFYYRIADEAPITSVSIGESICSKRLHFTDKLIDKVADRLQRAGKKVVYSTLAMVTLERERKDVKKVLARNDCVFEVNDLGTVNLLNDHQHIISPLLNVYNAPTARFLASRGAKRICLPPELPFQSIKTIVEKTKDVTDIEVFAFGRLPLAISARCAHARSKGHIKDNCQFVCGEDPNGLPIRTLDGKDFLSLNGIQTMSHNCQALTYEMQSLIDIGVHHFRLSPQDCDMVAIAHLFNDLIAGQLSAEEATQKIADHCGDMPLANGFIHGLEGARFVERAIVL